MRNLTLLVLFFFCVEVNAQKIEVYQGNFVSIDSISMDLSNYYLSPSQIINFGLTDQSRSIMISEILNSQIIISIDNPNIDSVNFYAVFNKKVSQLRNEIGRASCRERV